MKRSYQSGAQKRKIANSKKNFISNYIPITNFFKVPDNPDESEKESSCESDSENIDPDDQIGKLVNYF